MAFGEAPCTKSPKNCGELLCGRDLRMSRTAAGAIAVVWLGEMHHCRTCRVGCERLDGGLHCAGRVGCSHAESSSQEGKS